MKTKIGGPQHSRNLLINVKPNRFKNIGKQKRKDPKKSQKIISSLKPPRITLPTMSNNGSEANTMER
jgi:hypothetical protein